MTCGTLSGYRRHLTIGEAPCHDCRVAKRRNVKEWRRRRGGLTDSTTVTSKCGTNPGYLRHYYDRERPCHDCRVAHSRYKRNLRRGVLIVEVTP